MYRLRVGVGLALFVVVAGCSGSGPDVQYVEGVVTVDGKPIEGVTVGFSPVDPDTGLAAVGTTDKDGVFHLTATQGGEADGGTTVGDYYVTFSKTANNAMSAEETQRMMDDPDYGKAPTGAPRAPEVQHVIPPIYNNPTTSGFKVTVREGENTGDEFKFDLKE